VLEEEKTKTTTSLLVFIHREGVRLWFGLVDRLLLGFLVDY
jgi:hypothetical protein